MGTAAGNNNSRVLNQTAAIVSNFEGEQASGARGYVWASRTTSKKYTPSATYSHNSSGGKIEVSRSGKGKYSVRFFGLGGNGKAGGTVQVSGYGNNSNYCKIRSWSSSGKDFIANVNCYRFNGSATDSIFTALVTWP